LKREYSDKIILNFIKLEINERMELE
jgi:hypothetical protein